MSTWVSNRHRVATAKSLTVKEITSLIPAIPTVQPGRSTGKIAGYTMFTKEYEGIRQGKATDGEASQREGTPMGAVSGIGEKTPFGEQATDADVGDDTPSGKKTGAKFAVGGWQQEAGGAWSAMTEEEKEKYKEKARQLNESRALPATPTQDFELHEQPMVATQ